MRLQALSIFLVIVIFALVIEILHDKGFIVFDGGLELSSVLLTAASLVVTGVGVMAGILAIFGYGQIKEAAIHASRTEARTVAEDAARRVATEVASSVAARVAREVPASTTTDEQAAEIVQALDNEDQA
ncbi:hypothetical protein NKI72_06665 [Mesorhizobium sp. M0437]|uniref:hypothetical protein n=1 Tax=Mesorhizobium sp. M0437 TaxID=2956945 RepID=UPI00333C76F8